MLAYLAGSKLPLSELDQWSGARELFEVYPDGMFWVCVFKLYVCMCEEGRGVFVECGMFLGVWVFRVCVCVCVCVCMYVGGLGRRDMFVECLGDKQTFLGSPQPRPLRRETVSC